MDNVFVKNGNFYIIKRNNLEIPERYHYRCHLIANAQPNTDEEFDEYVLLSNCLSNIKFIGCEYDDDTMMKCFKFEKLCDI